MYTVISNKNIQFEQSGAGWYSIFERIMPISHHYAQYACINSELCASLSKCYMVAFFFLYKTLPSNPHELNKFENLF